jgi:RNA polymerase sigma-70 factor (ECF subfamily)
MIESDLVTACLKGRQDSQKQLYESFAPKMLGVCYRYASSREEAEDFLQETFITIFRKLNQYKGDGELGAWIRRITINTSLNCIKARHRLTETFNIIPIDNIPDNSLLYKQPDDKELMELVHQLPLGCRTVFNLYAIEGYSHDEIGEMLDIKASTSRSQYMKSRNMLMQKLNPEIKDNIKDESHG